MSRTASLALVLGLVGCLEYDLQGAERPDAAPGEQTTTVAPPDAGTPPDGTEPAAPVAVCSVDPPVVAALYERATWIGADSYDPAGRPLTYSWVLSAIPAGSNPQTPSGSADEPDRPSFLPDLVGTYTGQLVVTNNLGIASAPCEVDLEAIPGTDLWVEMYWADRGDDMDLHLVRGGGAIESNQDCYYGNCRVRGLSWGPSGPEADPLLDLDDIPGTGPENINIDGPEEVLYEVFVHDYPGSRKQAPNDVTVNVYLSGVLAWTDTRPLEGEDTLAHFATVDWAAGTVTGH